MAENIDYILFVAIFAAIFASILWLLPRLWDGARFPKWMLVAAAAFAAANWWTVKIAGEKAQANIERALDTLAPTFAIELEELGHDQITASTAPNDGV